MNRPGMSGDSTSWEGWSHVRWFVEEVSAGAARVECVVCDRRPQRAERTTVDQAAHRRGHPRGDWPRTIEPGSPPTSWLGSTPLLGLGEPEQITQWRQHNDHGERDDYQERGQRAVGAGGIVDGELIDQHPGILPHSPPGDYCADGGNREKPCHRVTSAIKQEQGEGAGERGQDQQRQGGAETPVAECRRVVKDWIQTREHNETADNPHREGAPA